MFLSHDDVDHINGTPEIIAACKINHIYTNSAFLDKVKESPTVAILADWLRDRGQRLQIFDNDIEISDKIKIKSLWPNQQICQTKTISDNNKSQVFLIEFAGKRILLCSDTEQFAQSSVLKAYPELKADIMVLPHHGSMRSLAEGFVEKTGARILLTSCSRRQYEITFKPPVGTKVFYTPINGAITVKISSAGKIETMTYR